MRAADAATADRNARAFAIEIAGRKTSGQRIDEWRIIADELAQLDVVDRAIADRYLTYYSSPEVKARITKKAADARARARRTVGPEAAALIERLQSEPGFQLSRSENETVARELGRLRGPLLGGIERTEMPQSA